MNVPRKILLGGLYPVASSKLGRPRRDDIFHYAVVSTVLLLRQKKIHISTTFAIIIWLRE